MGPFTKEENRVALKQFFEASPLILLRDEKSLRHITDVIRDTKNCHVVADSVFALAEKEHIEEKLKTHGYTPQKFSKIAISVREWSYFKERTYKDGMAQYKKAVASLSENLVRKYDAHIIFISSCQGITGYRDDSLLAQEISDMIPKNIQENITVDRQPHTPEQIMNILRDVDLVVATRMHMMIMALCVGTPVLPISYEFKTTELSKNLGLQDLYSELETITPANLNERAVRLIDNISAYSRLMLEGTLKQYASAMQTVPLLKAVFAEKIS
jgi:colanic acid/amylovoran biosynthesis protein